MRAEPIYVLNCYAQYDAYVTAFISTPDSFAVEAVDDDMTKRVQQGQEATWRWTLTPDKEGAYAMTFALKLEWRPKQGVTPVFGECSALVDGTPDTIWGSSIQTSVDYVIGLITIPQASLAGTVLAVVGTASQIPFLSNLLLVLLDRQVQKKTSRRRGSRRSKKRR